MKAILEKFYYIHHREPLAGAMHTHPKHEFVYCVSGDGYVDIEGKRYSFHTGSIYITAAGTWHSEADMTESEIIYFYFDMPLSDFETGVYFDINGSVLSVLRKLQAETREKRADGERMKSALLIQLLIETKRTELNRQKDKSFATALEYIDANYQYDIDIQSLAKQTGYSYHRFRHIFKEKTGRSPSDYIAEKRINMAKKLIQNDIDTTLTYIAYECGFASSSLFSNTFRTRTGMSPAEYRKRVIEKNKIS